MRGFVQVDDANAYKQWLNDQSTFKALQEQVKLENNKELAFNKSN
jgi:heme/copper-type cytochrome/quinol oxidase subunit 2